MSASGSTPESFEDSLKTLMDKAHIPGVAIATIDSKEKISTLELGITNKGEDIKADTVFGAASLSKPVFAYLVLKLIEENKNGNTKDQLGEFKHFSKNKNFLDIPLYELFPGILKKFHVEDLEKAKKLTTRMVLSHTTGLPIKTGSIRFQFEPGTKYGYSGPGIGYLQEVIEALTDSNLEALAKKYIFEPLKMTNSSFARNASHSQAANSLTTTASDYAKFVSAWMNDPALQFAFQPKGLAAKSQSIFSMTNAFLPKDWAIKDATVNDIDKAHVSWGLGFGLQLDDEGNPISAYHSGDMSEWRAWVAMNLKDKSAIVYFSNSPNGHILAEKIIPPTVELDHVFNFFFKMYGFARNLDELAKEKGVEFNNGLRKGCLSRTLLEEKNFPSEETDTTKKINKFLSIHPVEHENKIILPNPTAAEDLSSTSNSNETPSESSDKTYQSPKPFQPD